MWYVCVYLCDSVCVCVSLCAGARVLPQKFILSFYHWCGELNSDLQVCTIIPLSTECSCLTILFVILDLHIYSGKADQERQSLKRCLVFIKLIFACLADSMEFRTPYNLTEKHVCVCTYFKGYKFKFSDLDVCVLDFF